MTRSPPAVGSVASAVVASALQARLAAAVWSAPIVVGVSGGADSVALLLGLALVAPAGARIVVAHAEHDLREAAAGDRDFVAALAGRLDVAFATRRLAVRAAAGGGEGLEARARRLRYAFFADVAHARGARHVLVGHTADDQAETILHRILRGTGPAGLAGMAAARGLCDGVALLRPLLEVPRETLREFLAAEAAAWREDESNADTRHSRNFIRHEVLARCAAGPYPAAAAAVVRLGDQAGRLATALRSAADHLLDTHAQHADGVVELRTAPLARLDPHLLAEMFAALWERQGWPRRDMTAAHYARLAGLAAGRLATNETDFPGGVRVSRDAASIRAARAESRPA